MFRIVQRLVGVGALVVVAGCDIGFIFDPSRGCHRQAVQRTVPETVFVLAGDTVSSYHDTIVVTDTLMVCK
jgi:hypothetical protein